MYLKLFTSCKIVEGIQYSIILDIQRGNYFHIPNSLFSIIKRLEKESIQIIEEEFDEENKEIFNSYIQYLVDNEFGFITGEPNNFIYVDYKEIVVPSINSIIELTFPIKSYEFIYQLDIIKAEALHINVHSKTELGQVEKLMDEILKSCSVTFVSILFSYSEHIKEKDLIDLAHNYPILSQIYIYASPFEKIVSTDVIYINYITKNNLSKKSCGVVNSNYFSCNSTAYNESHCFNSCLAGKISIDIEGNIKNCPSMSQSFGNIKDISLTDTVNNQDFKQYWNLTKDNIEICKDCEFRYICTDCRAYTERTHINEDGIDFSKPLKCGYDPYTGEWEEWNKNPLKQKAINFYKMETVINNSSI